MSAISPQVGHAVAGPPGFGVAARPVYRGGGATAPSLPSIGTAGTAGFGVGIASSVPAGFTLLSSDPSHDDYGNYRHTLSGSVMVFIPSFYYKITAGDAVDIKPRSAYASVAAANAAGYAMHRAFYDGGTLHEGVLVDKYQCSKVAQGTGFVAASIKNGLPLSTSAAHNPIADITASGAVNNYAACIDAPKGRDDANAAYAASNRFFCNSRFIYGALALLSLAHGQAASSTTNCAWYSASTTNFPKGNNNNALKDANDTTVIWESDGYSNCGKTGSAGFGGGAGNEFAKSTHNGQNCGVADLNGNMWEFTPGITCIATAKAITAATQANPCQITAVGHGFATGDVAMILSVGGMTELNNRLFQITRVDDDNFTLDGTDSTAFGAYTTGGSATVGAYHATATAAAMADYTSGATLATDYWGTTGVTATMAAIQPHFRTDYANNGLGMRMGNGANDILAADTAGDPWTLAGLGLPDADGISAGGSNAFGQDYYYQYHRDQLALISGGNWSYSASAGVWASRWFYARSDAIDSVGFRAACYP